MPPDASGVEKARESAHDALSKVNALDPRITILESAKADHELRLRVQEATNNKILGALIILSIAVPLFTSVGVAVVLKVWGGK